MQFLCADSDFRTETELESIRKPGGRIHIYTGGINFL
jgi:hypothetical protein